MNIEEKKSGKKDACYHKVKSRYSVWPSAYASGALVKCRKKGAKNWGSKTESVVNTYATMAFALAEMRELSPADQRVKLDKARLKAFQGAHKGEGRRSKSEIMRAATKRDNQINARQRAKMDEGRKGTMPKKFSVKSGDKSAAGGLTAKGVARYRAANPGSKLKTAVTTKPSKLKKGSKAANRRKSFCSRMKGMKKRLTSAKTANNPDSRINKSLRKWNC